MPGIPGATHQEWGQPGSEMLGMPDSLHGRKGHGHMAGSRVSRRRPTTCDRRKAVSQGLFLHSAGLTWLCPTSHPMESWYQDVFMGVHTWGGVAHVKRCTNVCAHAFIYVCMWSRCCRSVDVCVWVHGHTKVCATLGMDTCMWMCTGEVCMHIGAPVCVQCLCTHACRRGVCIGVRGHTYHIACPGKCRQ